MFKLKALLVAALFCVVAANSYASDSMDVDHNEHGRELSPVRAPRVRPAVAPDQKSAHKRVCRERQAAAAAVRAAAPAPVAGAPLAVNRILTFPD